MGLGSAETWSGDNHWCLEYMVTRYMRKMASGDNVGQEFSQESKAGRGSKESSQGIELPRNTAGLLDRVQAKGPSSELARNRTDARECQRRGPSSSRDVNFNPSPCQQPFQNHNVL